MAIQFLVDATQYSQYQQCPLMWYEKYVRGMQTNWGESQRDDALCVGSLTHDGYANWYSTKVPKINEKLISELTPTPEALNLVKSILQEHARVYCDDAFQVRRVERQVVMPIGTRRIGQLDVELALSCKLDLEGYASEAMSINGGAEQNFSISRGFFSHESKTKAIEINRPMWIKRWQVAKQAVFQTLALRQEYGAENVAEPAIVLNVAEKPRRKYPVRKCKAQNGCGKRVRVEEWIPTEDELYRCPYCGIVQDIDMPEPSDDQPTPVLFRTFAALTPEQIEFGKQQIVEVAWEMAEVKHGSKAAQMREHECVDALGRWSCDFFEAHSKGELAVENARLKQVENPTGYMLSDALPSNGD